jgi:hypothetical protein
MTRRLLALTALLVLALCSTAAALEAVVPEAGEWEADPAAARGAVADVAFDVDPATGTVAGTVAYSLARCGGWSDTVEFTGVPVSAGRFKVRDRGTVRRARVDLTLEGVFDSEFEAHGTLSGKVKLRAQGKRGKRGKRARGATVCKLPKLAWTAELVEPVEAEDPADEPYEDDEPLEDDPDYGDDPGDDYPDE